MRVATGRRRWTSVGVAFALFAIAMLGLDLAAGALGWRARPVADSWCTAVEVRDQGVFHTAWHMYADENGRLSAAVANSVSGLHAGAAERLFPMLAVLLALGAFTWLLAEVGPALGLRAGRWPIAALAATAAASVVLLGRSAYQSFLWAPGAITHTWPPLIAALAVAGGVRVARSGRLRTWLPVGAVASFLACTFDEVNGVTVLGLAALVLADRETWRRRPAAWVWYVRGSAVAALAGIGVLVASPGFHSRSQGSGVGSHLSIGVLAGSVTDIGRWLLDLLAQWPLLALVAVAVAVGALAERSAGPLRVPRRLLAAPAATAVVALVVDVVALRAGYGPTGPQTTPRAFSEFFVPAVVAFAFYGLLLGRSLARPERLSARAPALLLSLAVGAAGVAGVVGLTLRAHDLAGVVTDRATQWDAQNARIHRAVSSGVLTVRYHPLPVAGLADPFWLAGYHDWVAGCVKSYYHVARLRDGRFTR